MSGIDVKIPDEPLDLKDTLRAKLVQSNSGETSLSFVIGDSRITETISAFLWPLWKQQLETEKLSEDEFKKLCSGYEREWWLWIYGDRRYIPCMEGFIGRLSRHLNFNM